MKIVFTAKGTDWEAQIDPRFGRTEYLLVLEDVSDEMTVVDNKDVGEQDHGAGPMTAQKVIELGADVLITGNGPGGNAARALQVSSSLSVFVGAGGSSVKEAYEAYKAGKLERLEV